MPEINAATESKPSKRSFAGFEHLIKTRLARKPSINLESIAVKTWDIGPGDTMTAPPAYFLPNQLERITNWAFAIEHPRRIMEGGNSVTHGATRGFLLKDVWLIDGAIYKDNAHHRLTPRSTWWPQFRIDCEIDRGALFCTAAGVEYFGNWLLTDCLIYPLASAEGTPVTTNHAPLKHTLGYEDWLAMKPLRLHNAFFRELVIFNDYAENQHKSTRVRAVSKQLLSHVNVAPHPGVFILRGHTGESRILQNEMELAEYLRTKRGFRILDPMKVDVPTIVATCAGAHTVIGVEGSQLVHGLLALQPGGCLLILQPPNRFVSFYKLMTDRDHQHFGFVVGIAEDDGFRIDPIEVERTLDLFPS